MGPAALAPDAQAPEAEDRRVPVTDHHRDIVRGHLALSVDEEVGPMRVLHDLRGINKRQAHWQLDDSDLQNLLAEAIQERLDAERERAALDALRGGVPGADPSGGAAGGTPLEFGLDTGLAGVPPGGAVAPRGTLVLHDVRRMLTTEPAPIDWIVEGVVARGTLTMLAGREKQGKSLLALALAACATSGGELAGIDVRQANTLVVDGENGYPELHRRVRSLGVAVANGDRLKIGEPKDDYDLRRHLDELDRLLTEHTPDLLVLDSWRSLWGGEENDSREVSGVLDPLRNLIRRHDVGAILIHHMRKDGGYRGSSAIGASVENILELSRDDEDPDRRRRRLHNSNCRYAPEVDDRWLRIEADRKRGLLLIEEAEPFRPGAAPREDAAGALLAALDGEPTTWAQWARDAGLNPKDGTARRARDSLQEQGDVQKDEDGRWRTPERQADVLPFPGTGPRPANAILGDEEGV